MTLGEYLESWIAAKDLSDAAAASYKWAIDHYLTPELGQIRLHNIERDQLRLFFSRLDLGDASKEKIRTVLRAALQDAVVEQQLLTFNPAASLSLRKSGTLSEVAVWTPEQAKRFLRAVKGTEHFPLFLVAIVGALGPA